MSTRFAVFIIIFATIGCADPGARFDEFGGRIIDGGNNNPDASVLDDIPDVTGEFLLGADPAPFPGTILRFKSMTTLIKNGDSVTITVEFQPLDRITGEPVGGMLTSTPRMAVVSETGEFSVRGQGVVPGEANSISGTPLTVDLTLDGIIRNEDYFCGQANGGVIAPLVLDLDGSTFGAIRIPPGTAVNDLTVLGQCIDLDAPDAGPADAMPPDATPNPDAMTADAMTADAA